MWELEKVMQKSPEDEADQVVTAKDARQECKPCSKAAGADTGRRVGDT